MRTRTLANVTSGAPERVEALRRALKGEFDGLTGDLQPVCGPIFAILSSSSSPSAWDAGCRGPSAGRNSSCSHPRPRRTQGSRPSAVRRAAHHAVAETLGLKRFDEDDLYGVWMAWHAIRNASRPPSIA